MNKIILLLLITMILFFTGCSDKTPLSESNEFIIEHSIEYTNNENINNTIPIIENEETNNPVSVLVASSLEFNYVGNFKNGFSWAAVKAPIGSKIGLIDKMGTIIVPFEYRNVHHYENNLIRVHTYDENEVEIYSLEGLIISRSGYDDYYPTEHGFFASVNKKWGYADSMGNIIIPYEYDAIGRFNDGLVWVRQGGKYGYADMNGHLIIPMIFDAFTDNIEYPNAMQDFSEGLAAVLIDGKCGFIDKTGALVIPAIYDGDFYLGEWVEYIPRFINGLAKVKLNDRYGYIKTNGDIAVPFDAGYTIGSLYNSYFSNGLASAWKDDKMGFIDETGKVVIPFKYNHSSGFIYSVAYVEYSNGESMAGTYIDKNGNEIAPAEFYSSSSWWGTGFPYNDDYIIATKDEPFGGKTGCIDMEGNVLIPFEYDMVRLIEEGVFEAYNYDDSYNNIMLKHYYDINGNFLGTRNLNKDLNIVLDDGKYGCMDKEGNIVIPFIYDKLSNFNDGIASAAIKYDENIYMYGVIDEKGEIIVPIEYENEITFNEGLAWIKKNGKWGIIERN